MKIAAHQFRPTDLVAGHVVLDFVNTVTARDLAVPVDWIDSYARLLDWAELAGLTEGEADAFLRERGRADPGEAGAALAEAKQLREALYRIFEALVRGRPIPGEAIGALEQAWKEAAGRSRLAALDGRVAAEIDLRRSGTNFVRDRLAVAAVDLLAIFPGERARICRGPKCGWLFIDSSKGGRRVWCDMATCGNAAKSRRHQRRRRAGHEADRQAAST